MNKGKFIVLEGGEGVGKTTQADLLLEKIEEVNGGKKQTMFIREPGGDLVAEEIREILLHSKKNIEPETELFLFNAARIQTLAVIKTLIETGITVISDRNMLSTIAYQGYGRGLDLDLVREVCKIATAKAKPDLLLVLDAPAEVVNSRRGIRGTTDRFEAAGEDFHEKVREGYRKEADRLKLPIIDASPDVQAVFDQIWQKVEPLIN